MKTTIKITFRNRKSGKGVLAWRVIRHRKAKVIPTSYEVSLDEWNETQQKVISKKSSIKRKKELAAINAKLNEDLQLISKTINLLEERGDYSSQDIVDHYRAQQQGQLFCKYVIMKIEKLKESGRFGTAYIHEYAAISFLKFRRGEDICIDKVNSELMEEFESFLEAEHVKANTISCYMRSLRSLYNQAIKEKLFTSKELSVKPFSGVFTGYAKTTKRAIDSNNISQLIEVKVDECEDMTTKKKLSRKMSEKNKIDIRSMDFTRNLFLFSLYTQGMSFSDMAYLKKENIRDGAIRYNRKKTGQLISVAMENCIQEIINRYSDETSDFIFPILREYEDREEYVQWKKTRAALSIFNRNLSRLARLAGIDKHLTSYVARHSWASLASQEGIPIATISRGMGHESEKTTQIYISRLDFSDVARANRKILSLFIKNNILPAVEDSSGGYVKLL